MPATFQKTYYWIPLWGNEIYSGFYKGIDDDALLCVRNRERRLTVCSTQQLTNCPNKDSEILTKSAPMTPATPTIVITEHFNNFPQVNIDTQEPKIYEKDIPNHSNSTKVAYNVREIIESSLGSPTNNEIMKSPKEKIGNQTKSVNR